MTDTYSIRRYDTNSKTYMDFEVVKDEITGLYRDVVAVSNETPSSDSSGLTNDELRATPVPVSMPNNAVTAKLGVNYTATLPFTYLRTLLANTDTSVDVPEGSTIVYIYHTLSTPVHGDLATVVLPVSGLVGQHTAMFPPNGCSYKLFAVPTADGTTYDYHIRSSSAGDVWITFTDEGLS